ncbi:hypothetical protein ACFFMM_09135 [Micromonospora chaiyaphumensis]|uniref:Uncharacterized protein n=1 Tax=Micromonospora chaiyaphumensis TaxID=307119 RepID=A0A1C4XPP5_9ACTN|nr:hypothetical protein [Micromonospora chaiyaphumensis]SCF10480.1 hypothetical protein GA0070214_106243 [Micromonospora chaiyaphumensis]
MARRGWGGSTAAALGVAAGAGAAQLGFGYGLGIINWAPAGAARVDAAWVASLAWATWISATSVIAGAVCAQRLRGADDDGPAGTLPRLGLALAAGAGALITVLLVAVPARAARVPDTSSPQAVAAGYAAAGLVLGVLLATWALHTRAAATNLIGTTGWLWLLAVVSVVDGVLSGRGLSTAQLGIWQISADSARFWIRDYFYWPGALLSLGSALLIGLLAARRAVRAPERRVGAAASGAAGPLLVALAYLLAVPRLAGIAAEQVSAHLIAPYAVIAGIGGSALMAALAQRADRRAAEQAEPAAEQTEPAGVRLPHQRTGEPDELATATEDRISGPAGDKPARRFFGRRPADTAPAAGHTAGEAEPGPALSTSTLSEQRAVTAPAGTPDDPAPAATGGRRGRAAPPQRRPESASEARTEPIRTGDAPPADSVTAETPGGSEPTAAPEGGATGPKARRRNR